MILGSRRSPVHLSILATKEYYLVFLETNDFEGIFAAAFQRGRVCPTVEVGGWTVEGAVIRRAREISSRAAVADGHVAVVV